MYSGKPFSMTVLAAARRMFHENLCVRLYGKRPGGFSNCDTSSQVSVAFAEAMAEVLVARGLIPTEAPVTTPQTVGTEFSNITGTFIRQCFEQGLGRLRPGSWKVRAEARLAEFFQYQHLADLISLRETYRDAEPPDHWMAAVVGGDYHVIHDLIVYREPETIDSINRQAGEQLLDKNDFAGTRSPLIGVNQKRGPAPIVHAAISCKWTLRSDRAQNVRTEALNLAKHRKGRTPHLVAVTAEPQPSRLASLALGTGEVDCVYHVALDELLEGASRRAHEPNLGKATERARNDQLLDLETLIEGRQLRDISDLPLDLVM